MPSAVHQSASMLARRLALVSQSVSEEPTGLVTVTIGYTTLPEYRDRIAPLFVLDNEPPIYPSAVNREELLTNRLYLKDRSIDQANGLVNISATYVGGLNRAPNYVYRTLEPMSNKVLGWRSASFSLSIQSPTGVTTSLGNLVNYWSMTVSRRMLTYEFVGVGEQFSYTIPNVQMSEIATILATDSSFTTSVSNPRGGSSFQSYRWTLAQFEAKLRDYVFRDRSESFQTPIVRTVTTRIYIAETQVPQDGSPPLVVFYG